MENLCKDLHQESMRENRKTFDIKLKYYGSQMETGDQPETDEFDLLDQ